MRGEMRQRARVGGKKAVLLFETPFSLRGGGMILKIKTI